VQKQVEKAKEGDAAAMKFVMGFISSQGPPPAKEVKIIEKVKVIGDRTTRTKRSNEEKPRAVEVAATPPKPPQPPKPVAIDTPTARQTRRLVGLYLAQNGPAYLASMETVLEIPAEQLRAVLNHPWFECVRDFWGLTPEGNQNCK
jgi:hypothetical protein